MPVRQRFHLWEKNFDANDECTNLCSVGYKYILLDDCWAGPRDANGELTADPYRFPDGMKPVIDYIHSKGLLFGLYTCAGAT
jgi:alpha-galactosidase